MKWRIENQYGVLAWDGEAWLDGKLCSTVFELHELTAQVEKAWVDQPVAVIPTT